MGILFHYQADYLLTALLCLAVLGLLLGKPCFSDSRQGKQLLWLTFLLTLLVSGMSAAVYTRRIPRGLSGTYYEESGRQAAPVNSLRYFETPGRRTDRFLDFNPNDFNGRYPFSNTPFRIQWQGYVYLPDDEYQLQVNSNFGVWLYVDEALVQAPVSKIDFGTAEARSLLREGWSHDELDRNGQVTFVWSVADHSAIALGLERPVSETDYELVLRCLPFSYPGSPQQELAIIVGDTRVHTIPLQEGWQTYQIPIAARILQEISTGMVPITFNYAHVASPADVFGSGDGRELAVAFDFVALQRSSENGGASPIQPMNLSPGLHRIHIDAHRQGANPFIQLRWMQTGGKSRVLPEDYLFPVDLTPDAIRRQLPQEYVWLTGMIIFKYLLLVLCCGLLILYVVPASVQGVWTKETLWIAAIALLAFSLRCLLLWQKSLHDPSFFLLTPGTDLAGYIFFARGFLRGYWPGLFHQPLYFNPLVSLYAIFCSLLFGENLLILRLITAGLTSLSIVLIFSIARKAFNPSVAYIAALFCACNGVLMFYDTSLLTAPLVSVLGLLALWLIDRLHEHLSIRIAVILGLVSGFAAFGRSTILLLLPLLMIWMLIVFPGTLRRKIGIFLVVCVTVLLTILPVTIRNYFSDDRHPFVLITTNAGINLWMGNNPSSTGTYEFSAGLLQETRQRMKSEGTTYTDEVWRYISTQPLDYLKLEYKKLKLFWRGYEIPNLVTYHFHQEHFLKLLRLPWLNFVLIGPLGLVGMMLAIRGWKARFMLYGTVGIHLLTTLIVMALARYRIPTVPILSMFAAYALWFWGKQIREKKWFYVTITFMLFAVCYVVFNYPYAAEIYQNRYGEIMPWWRILRYWDLFFHVP